MIIHDLDAAKRSQSSPLRVYGILGKFAAFGGLCSCASPWCVLCGARIARGRAGELRRFMASVRAAGGAVYMLTCTAPHDQGDSLRHLRAALSDAFRYVQQGHWPELKRELGIVGTVRGDDDPTWGPRGWHPHFHVLLVTERSLTVEEQERLLNHVYGRWAARIQRHGYRQPSREHGVRLTMSRDDAYIVKLGLADELASGLYKEPREGRISPTQLLVRFRETRDPKYLELYREFREAYHGRKKLTFSKGLRQRYVATPERSDEEIATAEQPVQDEGEPFELIFSVQQRELWSRAVADSPARQTELLACARRVGVPGVELYLQYVALSVRLAERLSLSPYESLGRLRAHVHDPPAPWEHAVPVSIRPVQRLERSP